jgi:hypothetical protein
MNEIIKIAEKGILKVSDHLIKNRFSFKELIQGNIFDALHNGITKE